MPDLPKVKWHPLLLELLLGKDSDLPPNTLTINRQLFLLDAILEAFALSDEGDFIEKGEV